MRIRFAHTVFYASVFCRTCLRQKWSSSWMVRSLRQRKFWSVTRQHKWLLHDFDYHHWSHLQEIHVSNRWGCAPIGSFEHFRPPRSKKERRKRLPWQSWTKSLVSILRKSISVHFCQYIQLFLEYFSFQEWSFEAYFWPIHSRHRFRIIYRSLG